MKVATNDVNKFKVYCKHCHIVYAFKKGGGYGTLRKHLDAIYRPHGGTFNWGWPQPQQINYDEFTGMMKKGNPEGRRSIGMGKLYGRNEHKLESSESSVFLEKEKCEEGEGYL